MQVEGKGNGIKTVIVNMVDVAKALNRPPTCESRPAAVQAADRVKTHNFSLYTLLFTFTERLFHSPSLDFHSNK